MLTRKQNVFDDFIACSRYLIDSGYTSRDHLAIEGGSNGGLLMGAVLTQQPLLYRAVVSHVGIYDMLRMELFPNGAFNITEYGTVKNPEQFAATYAYSPYHHVVRGTAYPAVFLWRERMTGASIRPTRARWRRSSRMLPPRGCRSCCSNHQDRATDRHRTQRQDQRDCGRLCVSLRPAGDRCAIGATTTRRTLHLSFHRE